MKAPVHWTHPPVDTRQMDNRRQCTPVSGQARRERRFLFSASYSWCTEHGPTALSFPSVSVAETMRLTPCATLFLIALALSPAASAGDSGVTLFMNAFDVGGQYFYEYSCDGVTAVDCVSLQSCLSTGGLSVSCKQMTSSGVGDDGDVQRFFMDAYNSTLNSSLWYQGKWNMTCSFSGGTTDTVDIPFNIFEDFHHACINSDCKLGSSAVTFMCDALSPACPSSAS